MTDKIYAEMLSALMNSDAPSGFFEGLRREDKLDGQFDELKALIGLPQNQKYHHEGDVWTHTMMVLDEAAKRRNIAKNPIGLMLSALCHDFGKAVSTTVDEDGTVHSYGHEIDGIPLVRGFMERFTEDDELISYVMNMTELHMEPNIMAHARSRMKKTNKLFDSSAEPFDLIQLAVCDGLGKIPKCDDTEEFLMERYDKFVSIMSRPYVTENDLISAGSCDPGKNAEILSYAHKLRLAGLDKDDQLRQSVAYARSVLKIKIQAVQ